MYVCLYVKIIFIFEILESYDGIIGIWIYVSHEWKLPFVFQWLAFQVDYSKMHGTGSTISSPGGISWNFPHGGQCSCTVPSVWLSILDCVALAKLMNIGCHPSRSIASASNKLLYEVVYPRPLPKRRSVASVLHNSSPFFLSSFQQASNRHAPSYEEGMSPRKPRTQI